MDKIKKQYEFKGVANTLFIPLEARIFVSKHFPEYFYDEKALSLDGYIPDDSIRKKSSEYSFMASVARYYNMDAMVKAFASLHKKCNVVYLGAGFETACFRLNLPDVICYEVDLPDVIAARRAVLGEHANEILAGSGDLFDMAWAEQVDKGLPSLMVASGVFQYCTEEKIVGFMDNLRNVFGKCELIFDATNKTGLRYANKYVQKTGNTDAMMHFYINSGTEFASGTKTVLKEERVFFADARKLLSKRLGLYTRIAMKVVDDKKRAVILHLEIGRNK